MRRPVLQKRHPKPILGLAVVAWLVAGCAVGQAPTPLPSTSDLNIDSPVTVSATGKVVPEERVDLGFSLGGLVQEVTIEEGHEVIAGQVLAKVDDSELLAAVSQAAASVDSAEAHLAGLQAGASVEEIRSAEAAVQTAKEGVTAAEVAIETAITGVQAAQASLEAAQASAALLKGGATADEIEIARQLVEQAKALRYSAQAQRDAVGGGRGSQGYQNGSYESAEGQVMASENAVTIAELNRRILVRGARAEEIAISEAQVGQAEAALGSAEASEKASRQQVAIANAQLRQAESQLALVKASPREQDIRAAEAQVKLANGALESANATLDRCQIEAPFSGVVAWVNLCVGEQVAPGLPVISIGRFDTLRVETTDLDEIDVARVAVGRTVDVTFDALPDLHLEGTVARIALKASASSGGTSYQVVVSLTETDPRLRWGMTAFVDIEAE